MSRPGHSVATAAAGRGPARGPATASARRWWLPVALVVMVLLSGILIALLESPPPVAGFLDPASVGPSGSRAVADLLAGQGRPVTTVRSTEAAVSQLRRPDATLVLTSPQLLSRMSLAALARTGANLLIVAPTRATLTALAPAVTPAGGTPAGLEPPHCSLPAARLAGPADMGGPLLRTTAAGAWRCYPGQPGQPGASLVRYTAGGHTITVLGTGTPLTNHGIADAGDAALALNLLDVPHIVWLVPPSPAAAAPGTGRTSLPGLIPQPVYLVLAELCVAVLLAAAWRMRRFGPLVYEPLAVIVRASETVRGHGRLYRARRARGRAATVLREATLTRITGRLGLPPSLPPTAICQNVATRTGRDVADVEAILFGPDPGDDAALVALAAGLDSLEGQVLIP